MPSPRFEESKASPRVKNPSPRIMEKEKAPFQVRGRIKVIGMIGSHSSLNGMKGKVEGPLIDGRHLVKLDSGHKKNILAANLEHDSY